MSLVAQCLRGSAPVVRMKIRILLKARENKSVDIRAASVHASAGPGKQREERRAEWKTQRRQVRTPPRLVCPRIVSVPALCPRIVSLRGCKKTKRKLMAHFQLRAGVHSQLRVIASLYVLRIFLTCLVGYPTPGFRSAPTPPAVQPPRALDAAPLPQLPLRVPAQPASMAMDWEPEAEPEPEPEPAPAPPTLRPPSARLAARHPQVKHGSGFNNARRDTERWLAPIKPHLQHLAAASSAGTSLVANLKHITVTLATWDAVWEVYLDPKWAQQRLRLYGAQDRTLEQFFKKLEEEMAELSIKRHGRAKQLVVFFGAASIGTRGGWGADAVLRACRKVVCRPRGTDQRRGRVVLVDEHHTSRVSSAVNGQQPLAPRKPPQAPRSSQAETQPAASEPGPSTPLPAKRSKRTKAEPAAEPTKGTGKAAKAKPAPQPGRWLDRDCNAALNMQRIGESRWRPLELCYWPEQGKLPAKGKEYPGLGYKRLRDKQPKAQQQPAAAQ
ncbi:hypothetical protein QJQ45_020891 [Haematococcus lacustris]|nr:hypothetical protein QJQ45_020891 [Haematococcus lacustris]